jgi:tetratricopeptide (TPR) repeat protein
LYNGNTEMGKKYIREAVNKDPDNVKFVRAQKNLMKTEKMKKDAGDMFTAGNYQESINLYTECMLLDSLNKAYNSTILYNRALAHCKMNQVKLAIEDLS